MRRLLLFFGMLVDVVPILLLLVWLRTLIVFPLTQQAFAHCNCLLSRVTIRAQATEKIVQLEV